MRPRRGSLIPGNYFPAQCLYPVGSSPGVPEITPVPILPVRIRMLVNVQSYEELFMNAQKLLYRCSRHLLFLVASVSIASASPGGIANRTQKSSQSGCGNCHGSSATPAVVVSIAGPDTVVRGQATEFSVTISGGPALGSGVDIAARTGSLSPVSSTLKLSGTDLVQKANTAMSAGSVTFRFNYSFNSAATGDTLYATGLSTNSSGGSSGDQWNWSPRKPLVLVQSTTGVADAAEGIRSFALDQNYPNPFNPATTLTTRMSSTGRALLRIFDVSGREIARLVDELRQPGQYSDRWDASGMPSGVYYARFEVTGATGGRSMIETRKLLLLK